MNGSVKKRRFRQRGGAKKKKKPHSDGGPAQDAEQARPYYEGGDNYRYQEHRNHRTYEALAYESTTLDADLFSYLQKIQADLNSMIEDVRFQDDEDGEPTAAELLAQNALSEFESKMHEVAMDPVGSRVLENLFKVAKDETIIANVLASLLSLGSGRVAVLSQHHLASHVLEALVTRVASLPRTVLAVHDAMTQLTKVLSAWDLETLISVMGVVSGSRVLRVIFAALVGIPVEEPREAKLGDSEPRNLKSYVERLRKDTAEEWHAGISSCAELLLTDATQLEKLPWETASCTALQSLIAASTCIDRPLGKKLATAALGKQLSDLVFDRCGSRFVERVVTCLGAAVVWDEVQGHLGELISHASGNFVAQRVFLGLKGRAQVKSVWDEVEKLLPKMLGFASAREGVALTLVRAAEVEGGDALQRRASKSVANAIGAVGDKTKHLMGLLLTGSIDSWMHWRETIENGGLNGVGIRGKDSDFLHTPREVARFGTVGMLIARSLLRYSGVAGQTARDSMASLTQLELVALCGDAVGSRLLEQWIALDSKNHNKFLLSLLSAKPSAVFGAAKSPYGAIILSRCVAGAPRNLQKQVMGALSAKIELLKAHRHGEVVVRKCRVEQFMHQEEEWFDSGSVFATRSRIFADILNDVHDEGGSQKSEGKKIKLESEKVR